MKPDLPGEAPENLQQTYRPEGLCIESPVQDPHFPDTFSIYLFQPLPDDFRVDIADGGIADAAYAEAAGIEAAAGGFQLDKGFFPVEESGFFRRN